jgi:hypothetical protein
MSVIARFPVAVVAVLAVVALAACGPDQSEPPAPSATQAAAATRTSTPAAAAPAVTPDRLCGTVSVADVARISGFHVFKTKASMSGDVSVCSFIRDDGGNESSALIIEYSPKARSTVEFLKSKGEAVNGFGQTAVWFTTSAELDVELTGDAAFVEYVQDVRFHGNDPKTGAIQVAQIAVPALLGH